MAFIKHLLGLIAGAIDGYVIAYFFIAWHPIVISFFHAPESHVNCNPLLFAAFGGIVGLILPGLAIITCVLLAILYMIP
jgi:hypothetical protein